MSAGRLGVREPAPRRPADGPISAGPATKGGRRRKPTPTPISPSASNSTPSPVPSRRPTSPIAISSRCSGDGLRQRLRAPRAEPSMGAALPGRVRRRALLRRLRARLHLGACHRRRWPPESGSARIFAAGAATPVDLEIGPGGDLFYVDILGGTVRRISARQPVPTARRHRRPHRRSGAAERRPRRARLDRPGGETLSYAWDLDGDGDFDDAATPTAQRTYAAGSSPSACASPTTMAPPTPSRW